MNKVGHPSFGLIKKFRRDLESNFTDTKSKDMILAIKIEHLPVLPVQQEATLYPSHKNQASEQAAGHPWKGDLWSFHVQN